MKLGTSIQRAFMNVMAKSRVQGLLQLEASVSSRPGAILPAASAPRRFEIVLAALELEAGRLTLPGFPRAMPSVLSSMRNIRLSLTSLEKNPAAAQTQAPEGLWPALEEYARSLGVSTIGYAKLPRALIFQEKAVMHDNAIVLTMEMDRDKIDQSPSAGTAVMIHETYDRLGRAANRIAEYLRRQGYSAQAGHPLMGLVLYPPLAQLAGLGWRGMSGLLITPEYGPRVRLAAVFTSIENLPPAQAQDHGWIDDFCARCGICVRGCPVGAITEQPVAHDNGLMTCIDSEKCFPYFAENHGCSICIRVCPFHRTSYLENKRLLDADLGPRYAAGL